MNNELAKGFDIVFTPNECKAQILTVYRDYYYLLWSGNNPTYYREAEKIKKLHNDLLQSCILGGVLDEDEWEMLE
jgi:hypothetical protein